jgi:ABC-type lipoprotein export system ATPase subunit
MAVVRARAVTKGFGSGRARRRVLDGADLDVARGELVAIVGRSGSGKSTLLHLVAGLDRVDGGIIEVDGERVDGASDRRLTALRARSIGFVFQFFHLVPELTGEENVLLPTRINGARAAAVARGQELIDALALREVARSMPHELSGGEQQRFAIARALVNDPPVVLADEPIGNLDPASGATVLELLRAVADEGRAVAMVTHQPEAAAIADRVLHLEEGRLV